MAKKLNLIEVIQKWMDTMAGQTFMNYAYSWGAAVVILGTLFKLTHLPGANLMLFIGMGTEVFVFIVAGFERVTERVPESAASEAGGQTVIVGGGGVPAMGGTVVIGGGVPSVEGLEQNEESGEETMQEAEGTTTETVAPAAATAIGSMPAMVGGVQQPIILGGGGVPVVGGAQPQVGGASEQELVEATDPAVVEEAVKNYAERLTELTDVLGRVKDQAERMSTDSEEMENLNRTLTGIATVYELQLRNISKQVATIEQIDEQTRRMAQQIEELNNVYARMIKALTVNVVGPIPPKAEE